MKNLASAGGTPLKERLERLIECDPNSGCWLWTGKEYQSGYGAFKTYPGKEEKAHRVSFRVFNGPIPEGALICHKCDTPLCVNPNHLYAGSGVDNMRDRSVRNRQGYSGRRLNWKLACEIRSSGLSYAALSEIYGIGRSSIHDIKKGNSWAVEFPRRKSRGSA